MATGTARAVDFVVRRDDLRQCRFEPAPDPDAIELAPGQVLFQVAKFALTSNNISYAVVGETMRYWDFFPAAEGWGRVPVWGFGDVARSARDELERGERVYGYFPISTHLVMQADKVSPRSFVDAASHRSELPSAYNQYTRVAADPMYDPKDEDHQMLLWPLFVTSFLLDDFLAESDGFGARAIVLSSASSKTAFGLAHLLAKRAQFEVIGLTSPRNVDFVQGLGCYDRVVTYDAVSSLAADQPAVLVDMAGDGDLIAAVHRHFGDRLAYSCMVGGTHWEGGPRQTELPGARPAFFFAPDRVNQRNKDWGPGGFQERVAHAWREFLVPADGWIHMDRARGEAAVERAYREVLEGRTPPDRGHLLSLSE